MASSSSSTPSSQSPKKYDVFISFRGEDTRFNFTSHLHEALRSKQIETYIDYRLEKGDEVWPSLEKAIEDSTLFLVIFSENYASSTWCLKELAKIFECSKNEGHLVIPVFYRVDPSHIRKQSGSYREAFEQHEHKGIDRQQLQNWREALTHAANLSGWHCSFDRNEAQLITEIIECVVRKLDDKYQSEDYLKDLIGIHRRMADVESLLYKGSKDDVRFIGIWGMGGMGKTTLAKALFNKFHSAYEGSCFLSDVREKSKEGIAALKKKLILKLLGDKESHIDMVDDAISSYAIRRLSRKKIFIVLDDVDDHHEQLENLAGRHSWFGPGSKILVTTRDKQVLVKEVDDIYQLQALNSDEAFNLFSINAFRNGYADPKVRELAKDVTQYAAGNPLALKVLGSFLYGKDQENWKSQLDKLQKSPFLGIIDVLKLSLEGLDNEEKNIFLHIACFFNGNYVEDVKNLLDACGYSTTIGLRTLEDKAFLHIDGRGIYMHHLIQEMGRQIVLEESLNDPKRRSRLWNFKEIFEILENNLQSEAIEGIALNLSEVEEICLSPQAFCSMPNLKFLKFDKNRNDHGRNKLRFLGDIEVLPSKLRLMRWVEYPSNSLPATFRVENLVNLEMPDSNLTKLWDGDQNLVNLRRILLNGSKSLLELPNFSKAQHLSEVYLNFCSKLGCVHPSILSLHSLQCLRLMDCKALTSLTSNTHLKSLRELELEGCSNLNKFSVTSENDLFELGLSGTAVNEELCSSSGRLSKIDSLLLNECKSLTNLPYKLADLSILRRLCIRGCSKLASNLRALFDRSRILEVLRLDDCGELFEVPDNISFLSSLRQLHLSRTKIETLPSSIKYLSSLQDLYLDGCERLRSLPELPSSILVLSTRNCLSLEILHLPLMSEYGEGKEAYYDVENYGVEPHTYLVLTNCMKLDRQSIKAVEARVLLEINKAYCWEAKMKYPGDRVPEWFLYKTQYFVTMNLSSIPQPWDGNFIFCAVVSQSQSSTTSVRTTLSIDGEYVWTSFEVGWMDQSGFEMDELKADHVVLWYDSRSFEGVQRKIDENKKDSQNNTYDPLLTIEFNSYDGYNGAIKEYGVCPTSAVGYQNYIKQVKLALHRHPNSNAMGLGCSFYKEVVSGKRKYQSLDDFEEMTLEF